MHLSLTCLFTTLVASAAAGPVPHTHVIHEKRELSQHEFASRWTKRDRLDKDTVLPVRVGLKQQNLHKGVEWLMDV